MKLIFIPVIGLVLSGCAGKSDYSPPADATGEAIFRAACLECHEPKEDGTFFELGKEKATPSAIAETINKGGFTMPAFPNISGDAMKKLSEYVLANSKTAE